MTESYRVLPNHGDTKSYQYFQDEAHPGATWRYAAIADPEGLLTYESFENRGEVSDDGESWYPATATRADHLESA